MAVVSGAWFVRRRCTSYSGWEGERVKIFAIDETGVNVLLAHPVWTDDANWYKLGVSDHQSQTPRLHARFLALEGHGEAEGQNRIIRRSVPLCEPWCKMQIEAHLQLDKLLLAAPSTGVPIVHQRNQGDELILTAEIQWPKNSEIAAGSEQSVIEHLKRTSKGTNFRNAIRDGTA